MQYSQGWEPWCGGCSFGVQRQGANSLLLHVSVSAEMTKTWRTSTTYNNKNLSLFLLSLNLILFLLSLNLISIFKAGAKRCTRPHCFWLCQRTQVSIKSSLQKQIIVWWFAGWWSMSWRALTIATSQWRVFHQSKNIFTIDNLTCWLFEINFPFCL